MTSRSDLSRHLCALLAVTLLATSCVSTRRIPESASVAAVVAAANGHAKLIDLTQPLDARSTFFPSLFPALATGDVATGSVTPLSFGIRLFPGGSPFIYWPSTTSGRASSFITGEHTGTHMDAPSHFLSFGRDIDDTPATDLVRPAVVVDVRVQAKDNVTFGVDRKLLEEWEARNGEIPSGSIVFLLTGYEKRAGQEEIDHPGFTADAADFMRSERNIAGVGTDSLSPDIAGNLNFPVHKRLLTDECIILENVRALADLPPQGAHVLMGCLPVKEGSGSPSRVVAILDGNSAGAYSALDLTYRMDKHMPFVKGQDPLYSDIDLPIIDGVNMFEVKFRFLPGDLPIDRETTAKTMYHGYHNGYFTMGVTTGTHVTFPRCSSEEGLDAAKYPLERLLAPAIRLDLSSLPDGAAITLPQVRQLIGTRNIARHFIVLNTQRDRTGLFKDKGFPGISAEAAEALMQQGALGILSDAAGIDPGAESGRPAEHAVHAAGGIAGGFLNGVDELFPYGSVLAILPMPITNSGAAPARIIAYQPLVGP